jgi:NAD(P)H-hydrate epimerase
MEILTSKSMAEADRITISEIGIPSAVLMENAARSIFECMKSLDFPFYTVAVIAGGGGNGGDGLALARMLVNSGYAVDVYLTTDPENLKGDAALNYNILKHFPVCVIEMKGDVTEFDEYDIVVDAIFGTGLSRPVEGFYTELIESINRTAAYIVSADIPSGLSGSSHGIFGICVEADLTVTFCRPKVPHCMFPAKKFCGETIVTDISIPNFAVEQVEENIYLITPENLPLLPEREADSHKGDFGHAVVAGGSSGKTGAPLMSAEACARTGAGLTTCMLPGALGYAGENGKREIMCLPLGDKDYFDDKNLEEALSFLADKTVLALGPGIGRGETIGKFVKGLAANSVLPVVLDADGLFHMDDETLKALSGRTVLTPHIGEFARLTGLTKDEVMEKRLELARRFAFEYGVVLVLKSADTVIALPDGTVFINSTGSPALAKGGSGDCLTGLITGFISQGMEPEDAAVLGCYVLGRAGEIAAEKYDERSVLTGDVIALVGEVLGEIEDSY